MHLLFLYRLTPISHGLQEENLGKSCEVKIMLNNCNDETKIFEVKLLQVKNLYGSEMKEQISIEFNIF